MSRFNSRILPSASVFFACHLLLQPVMAAETVSVKSSPYQTPVIELYTSQGCSSCPPADRWLSQLVKQPKGTVDVLALAFHVDYWDYIGWKDEYASPAYTNRQRYLARVNRQSSVYTPEFFVNGVEARGSANVLEKSTQANTRLAAVELELKLLKQADTIQLQLSSVSRPEHKAQVQFIVFEDDLSSTVTTGENAGHELQHQRVVRYLSPEQDIQPEIAHSIRMKPEWSPAKLGIAALVKSSDGDYLQSVSSRLPR